MSRSKEIVMKEAYMIGDVIVHTRPADIELKKIILPVEKIYIPAENNIGGAYEEPETNT